MLITYIRLIYKPSKRLQYIWYVSSPDSLEDAAYYAQTAGCRENISKSYAVLLGALVRSAEHTGLHRISLPLQLSAVETQVRRLLWYQICILDLQIAESEGSQPKINAGEFDTPLPFNVNDVDVDCFAHSLADYSGWTDVTFALIRYEYYLLQRQIWLVVTTNKTPIDLDNARRLVDQTKKKIKQKYFATLDQRMPIHRCAELVGYVLAAKCDNQLLDRYMQAEANSFFQNSWRDMYG